MFISISDRTYKKSLTRVGDNWELMLGESLVLSMNNEELRDLFGLLARRTAELNGSHGQWIEIAKIGPASSGAGLPSSVSP